MRRAVLNFYLLIFNTYVAMRTTAAKPFSNGLIFITVLHDYE